MRRIALACLLAAGCDRLFNLDRLQDPTKLADAATDTTPDAHSPGLCPAGFTLNAKGTYYLQVMNPLIWTSAKEACKNLSAGDTGWFTHLAVLVDKSEYDVALAFVGAATTPWVGAFDDVLTDQQAKFIWIDGETNVTMAWDASQPDQPDAQACARMRTPTGMDNEACAQFFPYLCECDQQRDLF